MQEIKSKQLNSAQITLLRLLDRSLSDQEVRDIQELIGNYFDQKLKYQISEDLQNQRFIEKDFEALRQGVKPNEIVKNRKTA